MYWGSSHRVLSNGFHKCSKRWRPELSTAKSVNMILNLIEDAIHSKQGSSSFFKSTFFSNMSDRLFDNYFFSFWFFKFAFAGLGLQSVQDLSDDFFSGVGFFSGDFFPVFDPGPGIILTGTSLEQFFKDLWTSKYKLNQLLTFVSPVKSIFYLWLYKLILYKSL